MDITKAAVELGKLIKESAVGQRLEKAKEAWSTNDKLRIAYTEYTTQNKILEMQESAGEPDPLLTQRVTERVNELFAEITENPIYIELDAAQEAMNALMNEVNGLIVEQITGTNPNCTHDCSTCGGCH